MVRRSLRGGGWFSRSSETVGAAGGLAAMGREAHVPLDARETDGVERPLGDDADAVGARRRFEQVDHGPLPLPDDGLDGDLRDAALRGHGHHNRHLMVEIDRRRLLGKDAAAPLAELGPEGTPGGVVPGYLADLIAGLARDSLLGEGLEGDRLRRPGGRRPRRVGGSGTGKPQKNDRHGGGEDGPGDHRAAAASRASSTRSCPWIRMRFLASTKTSEGWWLRHSASS